MVPQNKDASEKKIKIVETVAMIYYGIQIG